MVLHSLNRNNKIKQISTTKLQYYNT